MVIFGQYKTFQITNEVINSVLNIESDYKSGFKVLFPLAAQRAILND